MFRRRVFGAGLLVAAVAWLLLAGMVAGSGPFALDRIIIVGVRQWGGPAWLRGVAVDVTALGSGVVLTILVVAVAGLLLVQRRWRSAGMIALACWSGGRAVDIVKVHVARARPDLVPHLVDAGGYSFPSAHSADSAVVYLTLALLATGHMRTRPARRYLVGVALLLVGAIGCSRVYLGVHWPSDVLAGWSFGALWAIGWWIARGSAAGAR